MSKETDLINKLSNFLADVYQLMGRVHFEPEKYLDEIVPYMDVTCELLNETDKYFDDKEWDIHQEQLEKRLKHFTKKYAAWKVKNNKK